MYLAEVLDVGIVHINLKVKLGKFALDSRMTVDEIQGLSRRNATKRTIKPATSLYLTERSLSPLPFSSFLRTNDSKTFLDEM